MSRQSIDSGPSTSSGITKPRWHWFLYVVKIENTYSLHLGYKTSKGDISEYSCSKSNAIVKVPFDSPIHCEFVMVRKAQEEESIPMMKFKSRRQEERQLRMSQLNCFEGGENAFSRKVSAMVVDQNTWAQLPYMAVL